MVFAFIQVDDEPFPEFTFVKECCEISEGRINWTMSKFEVLQKKRLVMLLVGISTWKYQYETEYEYDISNLVRMP